MKRRDDFSRVACSSLAARNLFILLGDLCRGFSVGGFGTSFPLLASGVRKAGDPEAGLRMFPKARHVRIKLRITAAVQHHLLKFPLTVFPRVRTLLDVHERGLANQGFESPYLQSLSRRGKNQNPGWHFGWAGKPIH